jgi:hypothetical protein
MHTRAFKTQRTYDLKRNVARHIIIIKLQNKSRILKDVKVKITEK